MASVLPKELGSDIFVAESYQREPHEQLHPVDSNDSPHNISDHDSITDYADAGSPLR
jgi:hypothetical protein